MRVAGLSVRNVGGLVDGFTPLPKSQVVALAGSNGSGKSKFLTCLITPWTHTLTEPRDPKERISAAVTLELTESERLATAEYSNQMGFEAAIIPEQITVIVSKEPLGGVPSVAADPPNLSWFPYMLKSEPMLAANPSIDLFYMPAERKLAQYGSPFTLQSIDPADNARSAQQLRDAATYSGVLEEYEFEDYARTLCIAAFLPSDVGALDEEARSAWDRLKDAVDGVLSPKQLLPLSQQEPSRLRVKLPDGNSHGLEGLSSGERQALVVITRVFRAGEGGSPVIVDEPDAFLHPSLSLKLLNALRLGAGAENTLIVATHSPAILDSIEPRAVLRLQHGHQPRPIEDASDLLSVYRSAGFKVSAVTQADLLVITEGAFDAQVLRDLAPELNAASMRDAGGRRSVFRDVSALSQYKLPVIGVVDADVLSDRAPEAIASKVFEWPLADIEAVLLSSDAFIDAAISARLIRDAYSSRDLLKNKLDEVRDSFGETAIREYAIRRLRLAHSTSWPGPRDEQARDKLVAILEHRVDDAKSKTDDAFSEAEALWADPATDRWTMVRGKYVLKRVIQEVSVMEDATSFVSATLVHKPEVPAIASFRAFIQGQD